MSKKRRARSRRAADRNVSAKPISQAPANSSHRLRVWFFRILVTLYVVWLLVRPPRWLGDAVRSLWQAPQTWVRRLLHRGLEAVGFDEPTMFVQQQAYYIVLALVLPYLVCVLLRRGRPADTGWRKPNRYLLRIVGCSYLVAIPFLLWMVQGPEFIPYYSRHLTAQTSALVVYFAVVLFCEHFLFEGLMLAVFRAEGRWPEPAPLIPSDSSGRWRVAKWFGLGCPTGSARGLQRATRWLGVPDGCVGAILLSGVLFGLIHWGKAGREFLLAFPGGIFLSVLAYRCNSWHAPYLLHAGTVTVSAIVFLAMQK